MLLLKQQMHVTINVLRLNKEKYIDIKLQNHNTNYTIKFIINKKGKNKAFVYKAFILPFFLFENLSRLARES